MAYSSRFKVFPMKRVIMASIFIICLVVMLYQGYLLFNNRLSTKAYDTATGTGDTYRGNKISILQAKQGMEQGELPDVSKVEMVEVPVELAPKGAINSLNKLKNMRLRQGIAEREFLKDIDLMPEKAAFEEGDRLTEHDFDKGSVPVAVAPGSAIDIKLFARGGEDTVVISKAVVISRNADLLSFYLNGKEQELIKEAAAEGMLFAVQYLDDSQAASEVTYVPAYDKGGYPSER